MSKSVLFGFVLGILVIAGTARAHHGDAGRYIEDVVTISGTVVELQMTNPHAHIVFDSTDPGGKTVRWQAELGGPQQLIRNFGWTPNTVKPGVKITLTGRRLKSGAPYINLTERARVILEDGKEIWKTANYGQPTPPPSEGGTSGGGAGGEAAPPAPAQPAPPTR